MTPQDPARDWRPGDMTLVEFLLARFAEDESDAHYLRRVGVTGPQYGTVNEVLDRIPARVLAECEAKRLLIADITAEKHEVVDDCWYTCAAATEDRDGGETCDGDRLGGPCSCGRDARVDRRLRLLSLPYADHPGYRDEWRP